MYAREATFGVDGGGAAFFANNLSVIQSESRFATFAAFIARKAIQVLSWNDKLELLSHDLYVLKRSATSKTTTALITTKSDSVDEQQKHQTTTKIPSTKTTTTAKDERAENVTVDDTVVDSCLIVKRATITSNGILMQVRLCRPASRSEPIMVVLTTLDVMFVDMTSKETVFSTPTSKLKFWNAPNSPKKTLLTTCSFARGIDCVENIVMAGCNTGEILSVSCGGETNFQLKKAIKEHESPVTDIATCIFDLITVSADVNGNIVVWSKCLKSITKKISTGQPISVINILRKQVLCGTHNGQMLLYSCVSGELMAEVNAHSRQITAIAVAPESAYILSASEDSNVRIWKLHTRKPEAYRIEYRHCEKYDNASLVGSAFVGTRGNGYAVAAYESAEIPYYKISRKSSSNAKSAADAAKPAATGTEER